MIEVVSEQEYLKPTVGRAVFLSFCVCINGKRQCDVEGCELLGNLFLALASYMQLVLTCIQIGIYGT